MTAPVHFKGVKSAQGAKRPEGQMNVWTMDEKSSKEVGCDEMVAMSCSRPAAGVTG
jgi:hypothetical protein